jgi:hypothetical protein
MLNTPQIFRLIFNAEPERIYGGAQEFSEGNHDVFGYVELYQEHMFDDDGGEDTMFTLTFSPGAILSVSLAELPEALRTEMFVAGQLASQMTQYYADLAKHSHGFFERKGHAEATAALVTTPES